MMFFKHKLKKHLPYYRITRTAKRRLDEIAAALPPRETGEVDLTPPAQQEATGGPRHLKQEIPQPIQPVRERPVAAFMRVTVCAVVCIAFVGLFAALMLLRSAAPDPVPAASSELAPTATSTPDPAPAYTMMITNAETRGGCAFFYVLVNFREVPYRHAAFYTTELNAPEGVVNTSLSVGGEAVKLDNSLIFYPAEIEGYYRAAASAKLPESYQGGPIDAELTISALYGMTYGGDRDVPLTEPDFTVEESCTQSFELKEAKPWADIVGEANGVKLWSVEYFWDEYQYGHFIVTLDYPNLYGFQPTLEITNQDGRKLLCYMVEDKYSNADGTATQRFFYEGLTAEPERLQRLLLHVGFEYFDDQILTPTTVLAAEYSLFPQEDWFMRSGEYQDLGMVEYDMERITANWKRLSLVYTDHVYATHFDFHYAKIEPDHVYPVLNIGLDSDLPWTLPLQAEIMLETGDTIVIPLDGNQSEQRDGEYDISFVNLETYLRDNLPYRSAEISVHLYDNPLFLKEYDAEILIRNRVSGRVIATGKADLRSHTDAVDDAQGSSETPAEPEPSPEPPTDSRPDDSRPEDGQSSELPPDDSQSSADVEPEQPVESTPPEGESTPAPDGAS